jgi:hypothetical protein
MLSIEAKLSHKDMAEIIDTYSRQERSWNEKDLRRD